MISDYLFRLTKLKTKFGVHSPFVYDFCTKVLPYSSSVKGHTIEEYRRNLLKNDSILEWQDLGAGFQGEGKKMQRKPVSEIAKSSGRKRREGELLYRICKHYQPKRLLEFGTNLGISTLYQYLATPDSQFITMEGAPAIAEIAASGFARFGLKPVLKTGEFSEILKKENNFHLFRPDYVFIDGNHQYESTVYYAKSLIPNMEDNGILILDDIYWSEEMKKAWNEIRKHPDVTLSIDLFSFGICFIRKKQAKEHFYFFFRNF
ncbi:MAG: class I SAM-dependent methyltransferase [Bacteroidia bacterium]|nr:class I SAM-dependent methyltransferase [Bacteroidia bacterium]